MNQEILLTLTLIIVLGIGAQWVSWRLRFPSIVFLLILGFISGPLTGLIEPDNLFGELLQPVVSISVALILFEGGLTLRVQEFRRIGSIVISLLLVGVITTWIITTAAAHWIVGLNLKLSVLIGAILVVTGPTVIGPLLQHIRPYGKISDILKWEGITIDPIGALLAILVFETIHTEEIHFAGKLVLINLTWTVVVGVSTGILIANFLAFFHKKFWVPDYLQETVTFAMVITSYTLSEFLQPESGLFASTIMGITLANKQSINVKHILEFQENLKIIIISILFIILSARLELQYFSILSFKSLLFLGVLLFVARPVSVFLSTILSNLKLREKFFLSWIAPRGIVAAAISSMFAIRLSETDLPQTEFLVPLTFIVIVGTVIVYGLSSPYVARILKVAQLDPQGVIIAGAHDWAVELSKCLIQQGFKVFVIDTNRDSIAKARMANVPSIYGSVLSDRTISELNLDGLGKLLAITPNDEVNSMAALHFSEVFPREELYQLYPKQSITNTKRDAFPKHLRGRFLFGEELDFSYINTKYNRGYSIKATKISKEYKFEKFKEHYNNDFIPFFIITENKKLKVITNEEFTPPEAGETLISLLQDPENR